MKEQALIGRHIRKRDIALNALLAASVTFGLKASGPMATTFPSNDRGSIYEPDYVPAFVYKAKPVEEEKDRLNVIFPSHSIADLFEQTPDPRPDATVELTPEPPQPPPPPLPRAEPTPEPLPKRTKTQVKKPKILVKVKESSSGWQDDPEISFYGPKFYGKRTACGLELTKKLLGVAHRDLPCGTLVSFKWEGMQITVPVVDRGPYVKGRIFDLTGGACMKFKTPEFKKGHCFTGPIQYRIEK